MSAFITDNFLLTNNTAMHLYHDFAADLPIIDYHCHIDPKEIAEDKKFSDLTELWLSGDHYKWRLMRAEGIDEKFITGDAPSREKFLKWASAVGKALGNPLTHWTNLELSRYFGIDEPLSEYNAADIWDRTCEKLSDGSISARSIIESSNVEIICTTDDPCDDLRYHAQIRESGFKTRVLPAMRPDNLVDIEKETFNDRVKDLAQISGTTIANLTDFKKALTMRLDFFASMGCVLADHGTEYIVFDDGKESGISAEDVFERRLNNGAASLTSGEIAVFKTDIMLFFAREYARRGWTMQLHFGCKRNVNSRLYKSLGPNVGCDTITGSFDFLTPLTAFCDTLISENLLPDLILYSLNPTDNTLLDTFCGSFTSGTSRVSHGAAWWFNDNLVGMEEHLRSLCTQSSLNAFPGMLTDSRCFLSYTRHEYFRRILCNFIGREIESGRFPNDDRILRPLIENVCCNNARAMLSRPAGR